MHPLRRQFEQARDRARELRSKHDRTPEEDTELLDCLDRAEQLQSELDRQREIDDRIGQLGEVSRAIDIPGTLLTAAEPATLTVGEYLAVTRDFLEGRVSEDEYLDRAAAYHDRATGVTSDVAGIIPEPIIGPLIDIFDSRRKVWNSFTARSMPHKGKTFERPYVTQHVAVGEQTVEAETLASQKFQVMSDTVTKRTFGGTLEISRQQQDWSDPESLGLIVMDFVKVYARFTEQAAATHLMGLVSETSPMDDSTTAKIVKSYVDAVEKVCDTLDDDVPITIWHSTDTALALTAPTGATDRTTWEVVREALSVLDSDIRWVTSRRLPAGTRVVGAGELVEAYEQQHGLLSMVKPANLATDISYSGYVAFYGQERGFCHIGTIPSPESSES